MAFLSTFATKKLLYGQTDDEGMLLLLWPDVQQLRLVPDSPGQAVARLLRLPAQSALLQTVRDASAHHYWEQEVVEEEEGGGHLLNLGLAAVCTWHSLLTTVLGAKRDKAFFTLENTFLTARKCTSYLFILNLHFMCTSFLG